MSIVTRTYQGFDIVCLAQAHEWSSALAIEIRWATHITTGRTGRESRRSEAEAATHKAEIHLVPQSADAHALLQALATLGAKKVGIPLWCDQRTGAQWSDRIFDPRLVFDITTEQIQGADDPRDDAHLYAPLLVGHIDELPSVEALDQTFGETEFTLTEDSPWQFLLGVNATVDAATWPAALRPDWTSQPIDTATHGLEFEKIGEQRERVISGTEIPFRWAQEASFTLTSRDEIRTLVGFFAACRGALRSFSQPWWFKPGAPTAEVPATTEARFATDSLRVVFESGHVASARVAVIQVPWEIVGVEGETPVQPPRVFLYKFTHELPTPQVYRFTNWSRSLARTNDGTYAPAPIKHQGLVDGIDFKTEEVTLESFVFEGNPLCLFTPLLLEARLSLQIFEVESDPIDPDAAALCWSGKVTSAPQKGRRITARAKFLAGLFDRELPGVIIGPNCNTWLFSVECGLLKANFAKAGTLTAVNGNSLTIATSAADAANTFAPGWIEVGTGAALEKRAIIASTPGAGAQTLVVDWPLRQAPTGQAVTFYRGCDRTAPACKALGNFRRFRGHPNIPQVNLSLPTLKTATPSGKK